MPASSSRLFPRASACTSSRGRRCWRRTAARSRRHPSVSPAGTRSMQPARSFGGFRLARLGGGAFCPVHIVGDDAEAARPLQPLRMLEGAADIRQPGLPVLAHGGQAELVVLVLRLVLLVAVDEVDDV